MPSACSPPSLALVAAAAAAAVASAAAPPTLLLHVHNNKTWFGDADIALQGGADPVFMASTWVYGPPSLDGFRPLAKAPQAANWTEDLAKDGQYQTVYVATASNPSPPASDTAIDSLIFWNEKGHGIVGDCFVMGFNSAKAPSVDHQPTGPGSWRANLSSACLNVNLWTPWQWISLSDDLSTATAYVMTPITGQSYEVIVFVFEAQTGKLRWQKTYTMPNPTGAPFVAYQATVSADAQWVLYDMGLEGVGAHNLHVVSAKDGTPRGVVPSTAIFTGAMSPDAALVASGPSAAAAELALSAWDEAAKAYKAFPPVLKAVLPKGTEADQWDLAEATFSRDSATNRTFVAGAWFSSSLNGDLSVCVWDVADLAAGPVAVYTELSSGGDIAIDQVFVECAGALCGVALQTPKTGGTSPTVVVLDVSGAPGAAAPPIFSYASPGSMNEISVVRSTTQPGTYFVGAAGCDTFGVCIKAGADAYLWQFDGIGQL